MRAASVIEFKIAPDRCPRRASTFVGLEVDLLVFDAAPRPPDRDGVAPSAYAVHADLDLAREGIDDGQHAELTAVRDRIASVSVPSAQV